MVEVPRSKTLRPAVRVAQGVPRPEARRWPERNTQRGTAAGAEARLLDLHWPTSPYPPEKCDVPLCRHARTFAALPPAQLKTDKILVPRNAFAPVTLNSAESRNYRHLAGAEGRRGACAAVAILSSTFEIAHSRTSAGAPRLGPHLGVDRKYGSVEAIHPMTGVCANICRCIRIGEPRKHRVRSAGPLSSPPRSAYASMSWFRTA